MPEGYDNSAPSNPRSTWGPGDVIGGKYRLLRLLGEGGMGSVWVAENVDLAANVALKLIRADVAEPSANERFLSEARLAARLKHPAIVSVFDFGKTQAGEPFIVMELLEGESLGQRLARTGSIDSAELFQTLLPIIDALHSAHGHGVVHRDLKPDNVFLTKAEDGGIQPKLLDFGIAKLRGESPFQTTKLTQAGTLIGSPDYMSPEQARGEQDLDARSDVWALCVLAYECLVGKPPFQGDNYNALLWAILHDEPVPTTVFQAGDSELWRLLKRGFNKDRGGRWDSARQFGEAVAHWLENQGVLEDICHRSLQASWLPAERPTRPELVIPFDNVALPPAPAAVTGTHHSAQTLIGEDPERRPSSHSALVAPQTMPMLRRPKAWSLWLAGAGITAFSLALVFSGAGEDPTEEVGKLTPSEVTSPAAPPPPRPSKKRDTPPIAEQEADSEPSTRVAEGSSLRKTHKAAPKEDERPTLQVKDLPVIREARSERPQRRTAKVRRSRPKPQRKRAPVRKRQRKKQEDTEASNEFDFGI